MYTFEALRIRLLYFLEDKGLISLASDESVTVLPQFYRVLSVVGVILLLCISGVWLVTHPTAAPNKAVVAGQSQQPAPSSQDSTATASPSQAEETTSQTSNTTAEAQPPAMAEEAVSPAVHSPASACDPNYAGGCVPNVDYDLDCGDIRFQVQVVGVDVHRFDRDRDGWGCESYGR